MKKAIDVEKLLQWAMREELPKGRPVTATPEYLISKPRSGAVGTSGARVEYDDDLGFVPGAPCEDADRVAAALRRLGNHARIASADDARGLFDDIVAPIAGDAIASLMVATFEMRTIALKHAVMGTRPAWEFECPRPSQMFVQFGEGRRGPPRPLVHGLDGDGAIVALTPNRGRRAKTSGLYDIDAAPRSPLHWGRPTPLDIGHARAEYLTWFIALDILARDLAGKLDAFEVLGPRVARRPWQTGQTPAPRVLDDGRTMTTRLALVPKRRAPGRPHESKIERQAREHLAERRRRMLERSIERAGKPCACSAF